ncbi:MAG: peptidase M14, partial [Sphingobacteriia bacterium]
AELVIGFAENLLKASGTDSIKNLLQKTTYYLFPNMSPDASEQYFAKLKHERTGNATATDDDRDGRLNEDPFDDLDGNGKITFMRIESPFGEYKLHPDDARVLIKADATKGEKGKYLIQSEGIDNDKDGSFNEDGEGGIAFNKNLTYKHKTFASGAGDYPASEKETRALLDFLYDAFNVYAVVSFGTNNNLSSNDDKATTIVSDLYNKVLGSKDA